MDEITKIAAANGALLVVDSDREVWASASGGLLKKLMIAATEAEREECAKVVECFDGIGYGVRRRLAKAIRARSNARW